MTYSGTWFVEFRGDGVADDTPVAAEKKEVDNGFKSVDMTKRSHIILVALKLCTLEINPMSQTT